VVGVVSLLLLIGFLVVSGEQLLILVIPVGFSEQILALNGTQRHL
jgi:hypothetical protein